MVFSWNLFAHLLEQYKRSRKMSTEPIEEDKRSFLASLLEVLIEKLKWDADNDPDELDEEEKALFEGLRKVYICQIPFGSKD